MQSCDQGFWWRNNRTQTICTQKYFQQVMPWPGFEPGLSRPQREVLTTIRSRLCILNWKLLWQHFDCISSVTKSNILFVTSEQIPHLIYMHILTFEPFVSLWNILAHLGAVCLTLEPFGSLWNRMAHFGTVWLTLEQFGSLWNRLAHFGTVWFTLEPLGSLWNRLAHFGTVWFTLEQFDSLWVKDQIISEHWT